MIAMTKYSKKQERKDLITAIKAAMTCKCTAQTGVNGVVKSVESIRQQIIKIYEYRRKNKKSSKLLKSMDKELKGFLGNNKKIALVENAKKFLESLTKIKGGIGTVWNNKVKKGIERGVKTKLEMEKNKQKQLDYLKLFIKKHDNDAPEEIKKQINELENIEKKMEENYDNIDEFLFLEDEITKIYEKIIKIAEEIKENKKATKEEKKEINTMDKKTNKLLEKTEANIKSIEKNLKTINANKNIK